MIASPISLRLPSRIALLGVLCLQLYVCLSTKHKCISRESSPGHTNGNDVFYHLATDAVLIAAQIRIAALLGSSRRRAEPCPTCHLLCKSNQESASAKHIAACSASCKTCSATGTRTRVARVRAEYPNQLDYSGLASGKFGFICCDHTHA